MFEEIGSGCLEVLAYSFPTFFAIDFSSFLFKINCLIIYANQNRDFQIFCNFFELGETAGSETQIFSYEFRKSVRFILKFYLIHVLINFFFLERSYIIEWFPKISENFFLSFLKI